MRNSRTSMWLAMIVAALLVVLIGCGGSSNSSSNNNGSNSGANPGSANPGNSGGSGSSSANQFLYAGSLSTGIQGFKIDPSSGAISQLAGAPFGSDANPDGLATDPGNRFLYAGIGQQQAVRGANCFDFHAGLNSYTIASDGALTPLEKLTLPTYCVAGVLMDPSGKNLYVFSLDQQQSGGFDMAYSVGSDGKLTALPGTPYHFTSTPGRAAISSDGRFIYASDNSTPSGIVVLARSGSGALSEVQTVLFPDNMFVADLALVSGGKYLVTTTALNSATNDVRVFTVDQGSGQIALTRTLTGPNFENAATLLADRTGQYLLTGLYTGGINVFRIGSDGNLTFVSNVANAARTLSMTIDITNRFVYAQNNNNSVSAFTFDVATGTLTPISGSPFASPSQLVTPLVVKK